MFNKLVPSSLVSGYGPHQPRTEVDLKKAAIAALPPSFRSARHAVVEQSDPKRPPTFATGYDETETRPGARITSSDGRSYRVDGRGAIRREVSNRGRKQRKPGRGEVKARQVQAERLEVKLAATEASRKRKRTLRAVEAAERTRVRAAALQRKAQESKGAAGG